MPSGSSSYPAMENVFALSAQNLKNWRKAKAGVKAGAANARLLVIGDSTTIGINASGVWTTPNITASLAAQLTALGIQAQDNSFFGFSVNGMPGSRLLTDPRLSAGSWITEAFGSYTLGGSYAGNTGAAGAALVFTPTMNVDTANIFYPTYAAGATATATLGGGSPATLNYSPASQILTATATATLAANALSLAYASGSYGFVLGMECYNSAVKSVNIMNAGWWGSASSDWNVNTDAFAPLLAIQYLAPSLTIIVAGINDWGFGTTVSTFTANIQALITAAQLSGDVILATPAPNDTNQSIQPDYIDALYQLAAANNCVLIDNYARWVSYAVSNPLGLYSDGLHPTNIGYEDQANTLAKVLTTI